MTQTFELRTWAPCPPERLFALSLDIDAHIASLASTGERAVAGVTSGTIGLGESVTWSAWHFGIRWRMTSVISDLDPPHRFVDEQVRGPFRSFRHEHAFSDDNGGCVMVDRITLASPLLGSVVEPVILVPYLRRLIRRRNEHLLSRIGSAEGH